MRLKNAAAWRVNAVGLVQHKRRIDFNAAAAHVKRYGRKNLYLARMAVTITLLLMRHGLSCSNVLDGCMTHIENVDNAFQPEVFDAIDRELENTPFDRAVGYGAAEVKGDDCTLVLERPDQTTAKVRLHDAYRDPKLTDCGVELSRRAGVALRRRYAKPALVMSSTLQRARETAQNVYPDAVVEEAPFLAERAPSNPDIQLDNEPRVLEGASLVPDGVARNAIPALLLSSTPQSVSFGSL